MYVCKYIYVYICIYIYIERERERKREDACDAGERLRISWKKYKRGGGKEKKLNACDAGERAQNFSFQIFVLSCMLAD